MINQEIAQIFSQIAEFLEMEESSFESRAYTKAARIVESMEEDLNKIYKDKGIDGLKSLPGIGQGLAKKIEEYIQVGKISKYERLKKESPVDLEVLTAIEGLGPRKIKILYQELGIKNITDLKKAAQAGKIRELEGFGKKSEQNILEGIEFVKSGQGRFLLGQVLPLVREIIQDLKSLPEVSKVQAAGSARRMKETVGDLDILAVSKTPKKTINFFINRSDVVKVWAKGPTKSSARLRQGIDCDLRIVPNKSFGSALQYFTGNKYHNIALRKLAIKKKLKLNEYGVFKKDKYLAGKNEPEVYQSIGLPYIQPELRVSRGEVEAALLQSKTGKRSLPNLLGYDEIMGETQCHSDWSDGTNTIEQMAKAAKQMGYEYIVITDHAGNLSIANALDEKRIDQYLAAIDKADQKVAGIKILKGAEVDIQIDGTLAIEKNALAKLDLVLAAVHDNFKMSKKDMTRRLEKAIEHPLVNVIAHPTGRIINRRQGYDFDFGQILNSAKKNSVALEINAHFNRLDLKDTNIREAVKQGIKLTIGTDAHAANQLYMMEFGIAQARRGWAEKSDVLNTRPWPEFLKDLKN